MKEGEGITEQPIFIFPGGRFTVFFKEKKPRRIIDTEYHVSDVENFLTWCDKDWDKGFYEYNVKRLEKRKRKPEIGVRIQYTTVRIPLQSKIVIVRESGLHYVCQHAFDIIPRDAHDKFYDRLNPMPIGYLFTNGEKFLVDSSDISNGFSLVIEQVDKIGEFTDWIRLRRGAR